MIVRMGDHIKAHYTTLGRVTSLDKLYILALQEDKIDIDLNVVCRRSLSLYSVIDF